MLLGGWCQLVFSRILKCTVVLYALCGHFRHFLPLQELHLDSNLIEEVTENVLNKTLNLTVLVLSNNKLQEDRIAPRAWIDLP